MNELQSQDCTKIAILIFLMSSDTLSYSNGPIGLDKQSLPQDALVSLQMRQENKIAK